MLYELREYVAVPGRLPALIERFTATTIPLFRRHEMELVFIGRTNVGERSFGELVYTLAFDDLADMETKWASFIQDPDWTEAEATSEADGPLIESLRRRILDPSPFDAG